MYKKALGEKQKKQDRKNVRAIQVEKEIAALYARTNQPEIEIEECKKESDIYTFATKNKENLDLLKLSKSLKSACKEKQEELDECLKRNRG